MRHTDTTQEPRQQSTENRKTPATYHASPERKEATELLPLASALARDAIVKALLGAFPDIAVVLNEYRQIVACNHVLLEALGIDKPAKVIGQRMGEALSCIHSREMFGGCGTSEACRECGAVGAMLKCQAEGTQARQECRISTQTPEGLGALELDVVATPLEIEGEKLMVFSARDIAAEKRRSALERTFFHDSLNVAGGIQGMIEYGSDIGEIDAGTRLDRIQVMTHQLIEQIRSQRDLAAAERGELQPRQQPVVVAEMFEQLRATYECHTVAKDRTMVFVPPEPADLSLTTDPVLLQRVLGNLIKNALEASEPGQCVTTRCKAIDGDHVLFSVHNQTVMPRSVQLQVFQRSFSTKGGTGRGLGTFSIKLLTERYLGGRVMFTSASPKGTSFLVTLPRGRGSEATATGSDPSDDARPVRLNGVRVLVAEDAQDNQRLISAVLKKAGAEAFIVDNGREAVEAARAARRAGRSFDIILTDMDMPVMDGREATRVLRQEGFDGPILALTALSAGEAQEDCRQAGCNGFLEKPIRRDALLSAIRTRVGPQQRD
ncbi:MAG: response regulator [Phycisphaerae bacterium]